MRRGLLRIFGSRDGRGLAPAFAVLLFLNALIAGMHAGFAAAPGVSAAILCTTPHDGGGLPAPAADHEHACCFAGIGAAPLPALAIAGNAPVAPAIATIIPDDHRPPLFRAVTRAGPRAPPVLA